LKRRNEVMDKKVKYFAGKIKSVDETNNTAEVVISDETVDRYREIVRVESFVKTKKEFMKHPILLSSHAYRGLMMQIGQFTKLTIDSVNKEVVGKIEYFVGLGNQEADWAWQLARKGIAAFSIGFIPKKWVEYGEEERVKTGAYGEYQDIELLEVSQVLIPANPSALQRSFDAEEVDEDEISDVDALVKMLQEKHKDFFEVKDSIEEEKLKGVIAYHDYGVADKDTTWDAASEIKAASVEDLKKMCTWYADPGDKKGDYKLPHHKANGFACVWHGVANAAARLPQSSIPEVDHAGIKSHLGKHYKQFDETPPWDKKEWDAWVDHCKESVTVGDIARFDKVAFKELFAIDLDDYVKDHLRYLDGYQIDAVKEFQEEVLSKIELLLERMQDLSVRLSVIENNFIGEEMETVDNEVETIDKDKEIEDVISEVVGEDKDKELYEEFKKVFHKEEPSLEEVKNLFEEINNEIKAKFSVQS